MPLQGYHWTVVPLVVPALVTSRQPPCTRTVPSVYGDHCWPALPLQPARPIGLASVSRLFWLAAQKPPAPVMVPVAVGVPVGVELPPCS